MSLCPVLATISLVQSKRQNNRTFDARGEAAIDFRRATSKGISCHVCYIPGFALCFVMTYNNVFPTKYPINKTTFDVMTEEVLPAAIHVDIDGQLRVSTE